MQCLPPRVSVYSFVATHAYRIVFRARRVHQALPGDAQQEHRPQSRDVQRAHERCACGVVGVCVWGGGTDGGLFGCVRVCVCVFVCVCVCVRGAGGRGGGGGGKKGFCFFLWFISHPNTQN